LAFGQLVEEQEEASILYKEGFAGGGGVHNTGWYIGTRYYRNFDGRTDWVFEFDFSRDKHPKDYKNARGSNPNAKPYAFGKLNDLFNIRLGAGRITTLYENSSKNGVAIRYVYTGGLTLGLLKPFYLDMIYGSPNDPNVGLKSEAATVDKYIYGQIYGASDFTNGLSEIKIRPGIYGKLGMQFNWESFDDDIRILEAGLTLDGYFQEIEMMALNPNPRFFVSFYVGLHFGSRW
jgi:hypothetical protein